MMSSFVKSVHQICNVLAVACNLEIAPTPHNNNDAKTEATSCKILTWRFYVQLLPKSVTTMRRIRESMVFPKKECFPKL